MELKTICKNETAEIIEKKSKFIANIFYVETKEEAENYIKSLQNNLENKIMNYDLYIKIEK